MKEIQDERVQVESKIEKLSRQVSGLEDKDKWIQVCRDLRIQITKKEDLENK